MIPLSWNAGFSYLRRRPWQLSLAALGVGIGVAVIVAVDLANTSARNAFLLSMDAVTGTATHQVIGGPRGIPEDIYVRLRTQEGIRSIAPIVEDSIRIGDESLQLLGVDFFAESEFRAFTRYAEGAPTSGAASPESLVREFLTLPGGVVMSSPTAQRLGLVPGDEFEVLAGGRQQAARLLSTFPDPDDRLDGIVVSDIATAQDWFERVGFLTRIDVRVNDGDDALIEQLRSALPDGTRLLSAAARTLATVAMSKAFMTNLTAMSLLALLVGLFLIFNSIGFSVLQRRGLIGILRALGMTRRQLVSRILVEAGLIGLFASVAGVLFGILLGKQLLALVVRSINDLYFRVAVQEVSIDSWTVSKGLAAGLGVALLAAALPAFEATSYRPSLAMTRSALEKRARKALPAISVIGIVFGISSLLLIAVSGRSLVAGLAALFLLIIGFSLCVPIVVRSASSWLAPAAEVLAGVPARMAVAGIGAGLSRTGVAVVALTIALSATIGVSVMVDSFRGSVARWLDQSLQADVYAGVGRGSLDPDLADRISHIPGVEAVSSSRRQWIEDDAGRIQLLAIRMAPGGYAGTEIYDADPKKVWPAWENGDTVLVSEPFAFHNNVLPGDPLRLATDRGVRDFTIAAIFKSYDVNASSVMMSRSTYDRHFDDPGIDTLGLYLAEDATADETIAAIRALSTGRQELRISSNERIRQLSLRVFDRTFVITHVLYWLTMGVAFIGTLSAMLALQLERAREYATLRALGMTPLQVGTLITAQSGGIGLLSGLAAVPLGLVMAGVLVKVINRRAFGWQIDLQLAPGVLIIAIVLAVAAAVLAGIYPAYRAARNPPAMAMREE